MHSITFNEVGWRGRVNIEFTEESLVSVTRATAQYWVNRYRDAVVYVGYDTRECALQYAQLVSQVLASFGFKVKLSDVSCPLPALSFSISQDPLACGGIMVAASGSPAEYQGISLRNNFGCELSREEIQEIESLITSDVFELSGSYEFADILTPYLEKIASKVDKEVIANAQLRVLIDPMFGCARDCLAHLLGCMGVDVIEIHGEESLDFNGIHPRPIEPWIDECERAVVNLKADAGFVLDGDADRMCAVDATGHYVSPHKIGALLLYHLTQNKGLCGRVSTPIIESMYVRNMAQLCHTEVKETPYGFSWQIQEMLRGDVLFGTDAKGGIAYSNHLFERDGMLSVLYIVELMAYMKMNMCELTQWLDEQVGQFVYKTKNYAPNIARLQVLNNLLPGCNPQKFIDKPIVQITHVDGVKVECIDESWLTVRCSRNSEAIRLYAEASTRAECDKLLNNGMELIKTISAIN